MIQDISSTFTGTNIIWKLFLDQEFNCSSLDHCHVKLAEGDIALHIPLVDGIMPWVLRCVVSDTFQENPKKDTYVQLV